MASIQFLGAAGEVTGSCHLLRAAGKKILLDCGMIQGGREEDARGEPSWPFRRIELLPDAPMVQDQLRLIWRTGHAKAPELVVLAAELSEIPLC